VNLVVVADVETELEREKINMVTREMDVEAMFAWTEIIDIGISL
jgi:hypothetical protein